MLFRIQLGYSRSAFFFNKTSIYSRSLEFSDNLSKYFMLNLQSGDLVWSKNNTAPFNSQIKIYKDRFFVIDFTHLSNSLF